jgi:hypothetical protein
MTKANSGGASPRAISHPTPAESLASSGLIDVAAGIADFCHSLTGSVMRAIEISARGPDAALDTRSLRAAIFRGVAEEIIKTVEQRLRAEPMRPDVSPTRLNRSRRGHP